MEIKVEVKPEIWKKFEEMSGDIGKDRTEVLSDIIEKAHKEFTKEAEKPVTT